MPPSRLYSRSPRILPELPGGEVEIQAPPALPAEPHMTLASVLWPMVPGVLSAVVLYSLSVANGGNAMAAAAYAIPVVVSSYLIQVGRYYFDKKRYHEGVDKREQLYGKELAQYRERLRRLMQMQQSGLLSIDPEPAECLDRVSARSDRLWERSPADADFLSVRLGLGAGPFRVRVKVPKKELAIDPDPMLLATNTLGEEFRQVDGVPICLPLRDVGVVGICGPRTAALQAVQSLAVQVATHHAPTEVKLCAVFAGDEADEWVWLRWLPHVWSEDRRVRYLAADRAGTRRLLDELEEILIRRKQALAAHSGQHVPLPALVILVGDWQLVQGEPAIALLLTEGPLLGAYTVVLAGGKEELPKECRTIADVTSCAGHLIAVGAATAPVALLPDQASPELGERLARSMAPLQVQQSAVAADIPRVLPLLTLLGVRQVQELNVLERWQGSEPYRSLSVPIGVTAGAKAVALDLHERGDGPHGLVAGATGSGKSELLQTYMAALAVHFHPHEMAFIVIDYKGGGLADVFHGLPHLLATLTNLDGKLAMRALVAIKAELKRRMQLLREAGVNHVDEYTKLRRHGRDLPPLPHLLVLVDEFAELKKERPEFMTELISAVRVGRSLGVHLILATQKPAGVVDDQIWGNTRFRLCLRVEQPGDSQEVLRCPDAASIRGAGRGFLQVGLNERFELFQAGWGGAAYRPVAADNLELAEVSLEGLRLPLPTGRAAVPAAPAPPQLIQLVAYLTETARTAGIEPIQGPWLPPLERSLLLSSLLQSGEGWDGSGWQPASTWLAPVIGRLDDPENQTQPPLVLNLGRDGHLAVYGAPGMGKSTLLQSLAIALAHTHSPADVHMYFVDGSSRMLRLMSGLPHTGAVVLADETERLDRLMQFVLAELESRKSRFADAGVNSLDAYRRATDTPVPAILLFFDNYPALASAVEAADDFLALVTREGGSHGIHVVLTANAPVTVRYRIAANISQAVCLSMVESGDYAAVVGPTRGLEPGNMPGRGLLRASPPLEFQTALPIAGAADWERSGALKALMKAMAEAWHGPRPAPVRQLPEVVCLDDVAPLTGNWPAGPINPAVPVGLDVETLQPFAVDLFTDGPHALVVGPVASGKTTLLHAWLLSLANLLPPDRMALWVADFGGGGLGPLQRLPHTRGVAGDWERFAALVGQIEAELQKRRELVQLARAKDAFVDEAELLGGCPALVLAVDNADWLLANGEPEVIDQLNAWVRRDRLLGLHVILTGSCEALARTDGPVQAIREFATGFVLGSTAYDHVSVFNVRLPPEEKEKMLPPGMAFFMRRGRYRKIKVATAMDGNVPASVWVQRIAGRSVNAPQHRDRDLGGR